VALGARTASGDAEGEVIEQAPLPALDEERVRETLRAFRGPRLQVPPMYSALKQAGQPLYRLARAGVTVERAARPIELFSLELRQLSAGRLEIEVLCSKGTYVRVLAEELAVALGTVGHVAMLRRLYVEPFAVQPMHTLESLVAPGGTVMLLPADFPLAGLPAVRLGASDSARIRRGQQVRCASGGEAPARVRIYDDAQRFMGLGEKDATGMLQPRRLLNEG
jgi:tRNA pseudouridine55 synthase